MRAGGQARLAYADGARASAEQWASACIPFLTMEFGHHLEWDVTPALLAPLGLRAGANRRETVTFHWQPLKAKFGHLLAAVEAGEAQKQGITVTDPIDPENPSFPQGDLVIFDVRLDATLLWSSGQPIASRQTPEATPFGYVRRQLAPWGEARDITVEVGSGGGDFIDNGASVHVWGVRIENLKLGPLFTTGGIGITSGGVGDFVDDVSREVEVTTPRAVLGVVTGGSALHGHVTATHDLELQPDGYVTVDSRITGGLGVSIGKTRALLDAAIAKTHVYVPKTMATSAVTGGASLGVSQHLMPHLDATLRIDAARSFYAANVTSLDFVPRWGVTAFAALQATVGH
ncbi:MAG TPA: hypothetical protein VFV99_32210 [Kofleriaceae bacterium]|nr:hypothetical protein [Kofleriaceae bacterium]